MVGNEGPKREFHLLGVLGFRRTPARRVLRDGLLRDSVELPRRTVAVRLQCIIVRGVAYLAAWIVTRAVVEVAVKIPKGIRAPFLFRLSSRQDFKVRQGPQGLKRTSSDILLACTPAGILCDLTY